MRIFDTSSSRNAVDAWGPTATLSVRIPVIDQAGDVGSGWVLHSVDMGAEEIVDVRQCFGDVSYIYAMGHDQSRCLMNLRFLVFIGRKRCGGGDNMATLKKGFDSYIKKRISQAVKEQTITIGGLSMQGWLTGISVGGMDPATGTCTVVLPIMLKLG